MKRIETMKRIAAGSEDCALSTGCLVRGAKGWQRRANNYGQATGAASRPALPPIVPSNRDPGKWTIIDLKDFACRLPALNCSPIREESSFLGRILSRPHS